MATFVLYVEIDNAAFEAAGMDELANVLRTAAGKVERGNVGGHGEALLDVNGNRVGTYFVKSGRIESMKFK